MGAKMIEVYWSGNTGAKNYRGENFVDEGGVRVSEDWYSRAADYIQKTPQQISDESACDASNEEAKRTALIPPIQQINPLADVSGNSTGLAALLATLIAGLLP